MADNLPTLPSAMPAVLNVPALPLALQVMFDDRLNGQIERAAEKLSKAVGFTPPHLIGKTESCFAVVLMSLTWRLNPWMVAKATYQTPSGSVGFEGKLCQAIIEASGYLEGGVEFEHLGDWSQLPPHEVRKGNSGKDYAHRMWDRKHTNGLGVIVRAKLKADPKPRAWKFLLQQAFPLNSTLWATDPATQICYTAVRRFSNLAVPGLMMGIPFDREDEQDDDPGARARVVSPPAQPAQKGDKLTAVLDSYKPVPKHDTDGVVQEDKPLPAGYAERIATGLAEADHFLKTGELAGGVVHDAASIAKVLDAELMKPIALEPQHQDEVARKAIDEAPLTRRATEKVICIFPGRGDTHRESELVIEEASRQLLHKTKDAVGTRGAAWCERVLALNDWIAADKPTWDQIASIRDQCLASSGKKSDADD